MGEVGSIKGSADVVKRVEFTKEAKKVRPDGRFLWRRVALDLYDGKSWRSTAGIDCQMEKTNPKSGLNLFALSSPEKFSAVEEVIWVYEKARFASNVLGDQEKKEIWIKVRNI